MLPMRLLAFILPAGLGLSWEGNSIFILFENFLRESEAAK